MVKKCSDTLGLRGCTVLRSFKMLNFEILWTKYVVIALGIVSMRQKQIYTGGSHLSRTAVKPDSRLAQIFFPKIWFPFSCII